mgnify:CR=1 FL=1
MHSFNLTAVMYHYVRDVSKTDFPGVKAIPIEKFERQLDYLRKNYSIISWPDLRDFLQSKRILPARACILTFDDGLKDHYINVYPRLRDRNISGMFFPVARNPQDCLAMIHLLQLLVAKIGEVEFRDVFSNELVEGEKEQFNEACRQFAAEHPLDKFGESAFRIFRKAVTYMPQTVYPILKRLFAKLIGDDIVFAKEFYLQEADIKEMISGGMYFGGHGTNHFRFSKISLENQEAEIKGSAEFLAAFSSAPWAFSYPHGDYTENSPKLLESNGFIGAFSTEEKEVHDNFYAIGRVDAASIPA